MKLFSKLLFLSLLLTLLTVSLSLFALASEGSTVEIVVGETINPDTSLPYTLEEAWHRGESDGGDTVKVVLKTDNEHYTDCLELINKENQKTTLRLCESVVTTDNLKMEKGAEITIDLCGFTFSVLHQLGVNRDSHLEFVSSQSGAKLENLMDYPIFSLAPDASLTIGNQEQTLTLFSKTLFAKSDDTANVTFVRTHFDTVSLDFTTTPNFSVQMNEGCTFDMNGAGGISDFGNGFLSENISVKEGYLLAHTEKEGSYAILSEKDAITLTFLFEGEVAVAHYQKGVKVNAPSLDEYGVTINGNYYYPACEEEIQEYAYEDATYISRYTGGAQISANYSLNTSIDFHAYIPATDEITHINDIEVAKLDTEVAGGQRYYVITFPLLAPKDAHESLLVSLSVDLGEKTVTVDRYVSLIGYAESAIEYNLDATIIELILYTLDYINKTNIYFGGESSERIETLLSENNFTPYVWEEKNVLKIGSFENLRGACLDLNQTPGFVFYVKADYEGVITVNETVYSTYSDPVTLGGQQLKYIVVQIPANQMTENLTVTAGEDTLIYNLDTYIAGKASTQAYAHALYGYVTACKNYIG